MTTRTVCVLARALPITLGSGDFQMSSPRIKELGVIDCSPQTCDLIPGWCLHMKPNLTRSRLFLARSAFACALACPLLNILPIAAQSLKLDAPAPLHQGNNQALIDSFELSLLAGRTSPKTV